MAFCIIGSGYILLISMLIIVNVTADLDGTGVNCMDVGNSFAEMSTS